jgi:hypothetical protein
VNLVLSGPSTQSLAAMFILSWSTLALFVAAAVAAPFNNVTERYAGTSSQYSFIISCCYRACGTYISEEKLIAAEKHFQANKVVVNEALRPFVATIPIHFHVISKDNTTAGGNVPDSQLDNQVKVMNTAYSGFGITWVRGNTTRTVNANWFNSVGPDSSSQTTMKNQLRIGGKADLNVYTVGYVFFSIIESVRILDCRVVSCPAAVRAYLVTPLSRPTIPVTPRMMASLCSSPLFPAVRPLTTIWAR